MGKKLDLKGKRFGRLVVLEGAGLNKHQKTLWKCRCDCGNIDTFVGGSLQSGNTKSCGCLKLEAITTHGMYGTPTRAAWMSMLSRCINPNNKSYKNYGGRGISVCSAWSKFATFFADMGKKPTGLTLERIQNDLGYSKENCCWASYTIQARNRRLQKSNTSGCNGIDFNKQHQKWQVRISVDHKRYFIGYFATLEEAKTARHQAEQKYWRE